MILRFLASLLLIYMGGAAVAEERPLIDAHIHYSHDAWADLPPAEAVAILRQAGLRKAFVSSSSDEGTQRLYAAAPDLVVPVLRPYRRRGELSSWLHDETVIGYLEGRLAKYKYAGIGEFHAAGADADLPVMRRVVALARTHGLYLHAHSDADAVERIFRQNPAARVLWAHAGFEDVATIRGLMGEHPTLRADLAFRGEVATGGTVDPAWRKLFEDFPDRFLHGTDTYTPSRWAAVVGQAARSRQWLDTLPKDLARNIAYGNAEKLLSESRWK